MLGFFAQDISTYDYSNLTTTDTTYLGMALGTLFLFSFIFWVVTAVAMWKVFEKAGQKGWKALIPVYNYWVLCEIAGRPGWWVGWSGWLF